MTIINPTVRIRFDRVIADMLEVWIVSIDGQMVILPKSETKIEGNSAILPSWLAEREGIQVSLWLAPHEE